MNDIIYQIGERIYDLSSTENQSQVRNMLLLEIETYCRIALALAMDEVTRPDNYLCIADKSLLDENKNKICDYFKFGGTKHTLGKQLELAEALLTIFPTEESSCPAHIIWIRKLVRSISSTMLPTRNNDAHELSLSPEHLQVALNDLQGNIQGNPYLDERCVSILVPRFDKARNGGYAADVMNVQRRSKDISLGELLRISPGEDEKQAMSGPNASMTAPIALHCNAVYLHVAFPDGTERLHLLSPLLAHFTGREYGIYYKRQNSIFRTSLYISLSGQISQEQIPIWNEHQQMLFDRAEQLRQIVWDGSLFDDVDRDNLKHSLKVLQTTDGRNHTYFLNVRRDRMHQTYPELWHAIWGENQNTAHPAYFNVDVYDNVTLAPLYRMFRSDVPPNANPLEVCGQGGVGKTHTVINALFRHFIKAVVIDTYCLKFRYVIFLTAKRTMFNTDKPGMTYTQWENPDFQTCDDALAKILRIITDGRPINTANQRDDQMDFDEKIPLLVRHIRDCLGADPMLLIIDDLDSVRSADTSLIGEAKRDVDKEEQRRLVRALNQLVEHNDNCRVIITTRRPLDETKELRLTPLSPDVALNFARDYYRRSRPGEILPESYREVIEKIGGGIPAFIMRIIYLLNREINHSMNSARLQQLQHDIANFSLNTTTLNAVGIMIFSILAQMSNALDALPMGLLRIVLYDKELESINDAVDEMKSWSMIENRGNSESIALMNDSLILWSQLEEYAELDQGHQCILDAVRQDNDRWLLDYMVHPGVLMDKVFATLNPKLNSEEKKLFAQRIQKLLNDREEREVFFQGMQNNLEERRRVDMWISLFLAEGRAEKTPIRTESVPTELSVSIAPQEGSAEQLLDDLLHDEWNSSTVAKLLTLVNVRDFNVHETQKMFLHIIQFLPEMLKNAVEKGKCSSAEADGFATALDSLCGRYDRQTGERSSEEYLEPFIVW